MHHWLRVAIWGDVASWLCNTQPKFLFDELGERVCCRTGLSKFPICRQHATHCLSRLREENIITAGEHHYCMDSYMVYIYCTHEFLAICCCVVGEDNTYWRCDLWSVGL